MSGANLPSLKTRKLGRTNVRVTELGLGTAPLGELFDKVEDDEAAAIIGAAWDGGLRYFDTSPWYGRGLAEHSLGRALYRKPRDQYVISTKIGRVLRRPLGPDAIKDQWLGGLEFQTVFDYGYDGVMRSFEASLARLGLARIDVLYVHDLEPAAHGPGYEARWEELMSGGGWRALDELRASGDVEAIAEEGPGAFPWCALSRDLETVIEPAAEDDPVAWFPAALHSITTYPFGRIWAGANGKYLAIIQL